MCGEGQWPMDNDLNKLKSTPKMIKNQTLLFRHGLFKVLRGYLGGFDSGVLTSNLVVMLSKTPKYHEVVGSKLKIFKITP